MNGDKIVDIKGSAQQLTTIVVEINSDDTATILAELADLNRRGTDFFDHTLAVIDYNGDSADILDWSSIFQACFNLGLYPVSVRSANNQSALNHILSDVCSQQLRHPNWSQDKHTSVTDETTTPPFTKPQQHELDLALPPLAIDSKHDSASTTIWHNNHHLGDGSSLVIDQTIRGGQRVYAQRSDLIVLGDIESGAEVIADGNVHVYGKSHGRIVAGANGQTKARIFCTYMAAELLSIAGYFRLFEHVKHESFHKKAVHAWLLEDANTVRLQIKTIAL